MAIQENTIRTELRSGIVIDKQQLSKLDSVMLGAFMAETYSKGLPVVIVDNATIWFTATNLMLKLELGDKDWQLIAEKFDIEISESELATINSAINIRKRIVLAAKGKLPVYPFVNVPDNYNIEEFIQIGKHHINRHGYRTSTGNVVRIWEAASQLWSKGQAQGQHVMYIRADYSEKSVTVWKDRVQIGCQQVPRLEVEQLALKMDLPFPDAE